MRGDKRLLLTLATGSGKTFVAIQIIWKLWGDTWRTDRNPRVLYLADRNVLVDDPHPHPSLAEALCAGGRQAGSRSRSVGCPVISAMSS